MEAANDNHQRPREFDDKLVAHLPFLHKISRELARNSEEAEELVAMTLLAALRRWRVAVQYASFMNWLRLTMRAQRNWMIRKIRPTAEMPLNLAASVNVEASVDANAVVASLSGSRKGRMMLAVGAGYTYEEAGAMEGVSRKRVYQIVQEYRRAA
ncbi:sigma-70 family RNA polymerase sigma factor [Limoniibacter endophyticus]|uniref:Uncharacterized protein n=1 Tax=Limoniibacter endophyticus TaxID=1565040 RepID=A0A8J3DKN3_9HYPH|nr:sigma-70 family RNA polymerase sigma factor [Limoniibacter endophyticus]GHC61390.1 hypothetical protein GCM10010136_01900 [Limoniibacter endophyticus]